MSNWVITIDTVGHVRSATKKNNKKNEIKWKYQQIPSAFKEFSEQLNAIINNSSFFENHREERNVLKKASRAGERPQPEESKYGSCLFSCFFLSYFFFFNFACMTWLRQVDESNAAKIKLRAKRARRTEWQFKKGFWPKDDLRRIGD